MAKTKIRLQEFSGGMQNTTSRFLQKDNELSLLLNGHTDNIGSITKRLGYRKCGDADIQDGESPSILYDGGTYLYSAVSNASNVKVWHNDDAADPRTGTWTETTGGTALPDDINVSMARFTELKQLYIVGAKSAPTAASDFMVTQVVAAEPTVPETKADASTAQFPRAKYVVRWLDRLYFGYCYATWVTEGALIKSNRVVYTEAPAAGALAGQTINDAAFTNFFEIDDPITGMAPGADALTVFTKTALWDYTIDSLKRKYSIGCENHNTIRSLDIYTLWYSSLNNGIYARSGGKPEKISNKISPIVKAIANPSACFAWVDDEHYYLYVGTLTLDGNSYQNCVLAYSIETNTWAIYKFRLPYSSGTTEYTMTAAGEFTNSSSVTRPFFAASTGQAYQLSHPGDSTKWYKDGDQSNETFAIELKAQTKSFDLGTPEQRKYTDRGAVFATNWVGITLKSRVDDGSWVTQGPLDGFSTILPMDVDTGQFIQYEFSEIGDTTSPQIEALAFNVMQDGEQLE